MKLAYITAGAAGMYCGSCMHDNTLARSLTRLGAEVVLVPTYTPIRTDEVDVSIDRVFFGGINVYLQQKIPLFRYLPALLDRFFDQPWLIRMATSRGVETSAKELGELTVSMLRGRSGYQRKEVRKLCKWLARDDARPDLIVMSNMLIAGCAPSLKESLGAPLLATLQGDDIFLEELPEPSRSKAFDELRRLVQHIDGFIVNSEYYADFMSDYLAIPRERFHIVPLGLDTQDFAEFVERGPPPASRPPTIGYLARLAPEKGLHQLVDAFLQLHQRLGATDARLHIAGWLGNHQKEYAEREFQRLRQAGLEDRFQYVGSVDRDGKVEFLKGIDLLSVPTVYREPKGLFVLESLAAGVPVVQPAHGAFPEMLERLGGGRLVPPGDADQLARAILDLIKDPTARRELSEAGRQNVHQHHNADAMARATIEVLERYL